MVTLIGDSPTQPRKTAMVDSSGLVNFETGPPVTVTGSRIRQMDVSCGRNSEELGGSPLASVNSPIFGQDASISCPRLEDASR